MIYLLSKIILIFYIYILINYLKKILEMEIILKLDYYYFEKPLSFDSF